MRTLDMNRQKLIEHWLRENFDDEWDRSYIDFNHIIFYEHLEDEDPYQHMARTLEEYLKSYNK